MSIDLTIERFAYTDMGTFGRIMVDGQTLYTVERPWQGNEPRVSCIPENQYKCSPRHYNRGGYAAVEIKNVPGRTYILFHRGNTMHDLAGCIAVTSKLSTIKGIWAGLRSREAFALFMHHFGNRKFTLLIKHYEPKGMKTFIKTSK